YRLGVDGDALHLGTGDLEAVFQRRYGSMNALHGEIVGQSAVAGEVDVIARAGDLDFVHIGYFRELPGGVAKAPLDPPIVLGDFFGQFDGGRLAFDVGEYGVDFRYFAENL